MFLQLFLILNCESLYMRSFFRILSDTDDTNKYLLYLTWVQVNSKPSIIMNHVKFYRSKLISGEGTVLIQGWRDGDFSFNLLLYLYSQGKNGFTREKGEIEQLVSIIRQDKLWAGNRQCSDSGTSLIIPSQVKPCN